MLLPCDVRKLSVLVGLWRGDDHVTISGVVSLLGVLVAFKYNAT